MRKEKRSTFLHVLRWKFVKVWAAIRHQYLRCLGMWAWDGSRLILFNKKKPKKWYGLDIYTGEGKLGKSEDIQLFHYLFYRHCPRWATQIPLLQFLQEVLGFLREQAQGLVGTHSNSPLQMARSGKAWQGSNTGVILKGTDVLRSIRHPSLPLGRLQLL